jgi:hypothetical protein
MKMIVMTISISIRVNPEKRLRRWGACAAGSEFCAGLSTVGEGIDVEHVVAAPASGVRFVLHGAEAPVGVSGGGVREDLSQEAHLAHVGAGLSGLAGGDAGDRGAAGAHLDPGDQGFQVWRVAFAAHLGADQVAVGGVLIAVNRISHFA